MKSLLSFGWISSIYFIIGSFVLGWLLPGYNIYAQTLSEIGEIGSPFYIHWMIFDIIHSIFLLLFFVGIFFFAQKNRLSKTPVLFIFLIGFVGFFSSIFASPHPLHNVFGSCNLIGYLAPLFFFLFWKNSLGKQFRLVSLFVFILIVVGTVLNLNPMFDPLLYPMEYYGIAQRFVIWTISLYCGFISIKTIQYSNASLDQNS